MKGALMPSADPALAGDEAARALVSASASWPGTGTTELARSVGIAVEAGIRLGVLLVLVAWCFWLTRPFIVAVLWGVILAVAVNPGYQRLCVWLSGRRGLAAVLLTAFMLLLLVGPLTMLASNLVRNIADLATRLTDSRITVPPPPPAVASWPIVGERLAQLWGLASVNLLGALADVRPQLHALALWLLSLVRGASLGVVNAIAAVVIAGVLLAHSAGGHAVAEGFATRLIGARGPGLANLAEHTIRNVARGVLGTAVIQSSFAGVGLIAAGVPWAALLTLGCFFLCVAQLGPALILLGAVIYMFSTADALTATVFLVWCVAVSLIDNVLRPVLMSRGGEVPLAVILAGVLGGLLAHGLIGLFVGPIVLALGYELFKIWLAGPGGEPARRAHST
jgi:predicted PurR-regulated permease PerM